MIHVLQSERIEFRLNDDYNLGVYNYALLDFPPPSHFYSALVLVAASDTKHLLDGPNPSKESVVPDDVVNLRHLGVRFYLLNHKAQKIKFYLQSEMLCVISTFLVQYNVSATRFYLKYLHDDPDKDVNWAGALEAISPGDSEAAGDDGFGDSLQLASGPISQANS